MIVFQWIAIPLLLLLVLTEVNGFRLRRGSAAWRFLRMALWSVAAVLIAWPGVTTQVAHALGIGRGTDLLLYMLLLTTPLALFHLYARHFSLQREIVELARREALRTVVAGRGLRNEWLRPERLDAAATEEGPLP